MPSVPTMGERAYAYAKACGIIGKSFIGSRSRRLQSIDRLSEFDRLIFPDTHRDLPERELLVDLERRITARAVGQIVSVVSVFSKVPKAIALLVRSYEYGDLKNVLNALASGEPAAPFTADLGEFAEFDFSKYPDLKAVLGGSDASWLLDRSSQVGMGKNISDVSVQIEVDRRYYAALWKAIGVLPLSDKRVMELLTAEEIALKNIVWILRLRTYYGIAGDELAALLIEIPNGAASLSRDAMDCAHLPLDQRPAWQGWKRAYLLNPEHPGDFWKVDPRFVQNAVAMRLYKMARSKFRLKPFSLDMCACFIKMKTFEEDLLTSVAEGISLGLPVAEILSLLEVQP